MASVQKLPELPFRLPAAALQRAASQAISVAESLRAPDRGLSKQGSTGGNKIVGTKQHFAQKVSFQTACPPFVWYHLACSQMLSVDSYGMGFMPVRPRAFMTSGMHPGGPPSGGCRASKA